MSIPLLVDGDSICYRAAAAAEGTEWIVTFDGIEVNRFKYKKDAEKWVDSQELRVGMPPQQMIVEFFKEKHPEDVSHALHNAKIIMGDIINMKLNGNPERHVEVYLTGDTNYRDEIATIKGYKANRIGMEKPFHLQAVRDYLVKKYDAVVVEGYEADDALSMRATEDPEAIMVSIDKDLLTVPGKHYRLVTEEKIVVTVEQAKYNFFKQMLMGDTVDNIQGIPGIGEKKAVKILDESDNYPCSVGLQYAVAYDDPESAYVENFRLLHMSRNKPDDGGDYLWG